LLGVEFVALAAYLETLRRKTVLQVALAHLGLVVDVGPRVVARLGGTPAPARRR
jgi:hypothetical protein